LEGYAYTAQGRVFNIAENTGILKYKLWQSRIPVEVVPPTTIKKTATGKGNSDKSKMYEQFMEDTSVPLMELVSPDKTKISNPVCDIVDSYYICKYLHEKLND